MSRCITGGFLRRVHFHECVIYSLFLELFEIRVIELKRCSIQVNWETDRQTEAEITRWHFALCTSVLREKPKVIPLIRCSSPLELVSLLPSSQEADTGPCQSRYLRSNLVLSSNLSLRLPKNLSFSSFRTVIYASVICSMLTTCSAPTLICPP